MKQDTNAKSQKEQLEDLLLDLIREGARTGNSNGVPELAHELIELWSRFG